MKHHGRLILGITLAFAVATPLAAQRGQRGFGNPGARDATPGLRAGGGVERVLQLREDLELTEQQIEELNALRSGQLQRRQEAAAAMMKLRSDMGAGEITRSEMRDALEASRDGVREESDRVRGQIEEILTTEQIEALGQRVRRARRAGMRTGTRGQIRGQRGDLRGGRGGPGLRRGGQAGPRASLRRGGVTPFGRGFAPSRGFRRPGR